MLSSVRLYIQRQCRLCYIGAIERPVAMMCGATRYIQDGRKVPSFLKDTEGSSAGSGRVGAARVSKRAPLATTAHAPGRAI